MSFTKCKVRVLSSVSKNLIGGACAGITHCGLLRGVQCLPPKYSSLKKERKDYRIL